MRGAEERWRFKFTRPERSKLIDLEPGKGGVGARAQVDSDSQVNPHMSNMFTSPREF